MKIGAEQVQLMAMARGWFFDFERHLRPETQAAIIEDLAEAFHNWVLDIEAARRNSAERQSIVDRNHWIKARTARLSKIGRGVVACVTCGEAELEALVIDHIHPKARGGRNRLDNYQVLCRTCNGEKGTKTMAEWLGIWA